MTNLDSKNQINLKISKDTGRFPYSELAKIDLCVRVNYENSEISSQEFRGNIDVIKNVFRRYELPAIKEKNPVAITLLVKDKENLPQFKLAIPEITQILYFYLLKRVRTQLQKIPDQFLTTEFSAAILSVQHDYLL